MLLEKYVGPGDPEKMSFDSSRQTPEEEVKATDITKSASA
jgi:hypothetical protein